jgi:uncharacterized protein with HEPN domain
MNEKARIALVKMARYAREIQSYVAAMNYDAFLSDSKTINACAFLIGQIGELINVVDAETQNNYPSIPWRNIKGMRNRIIHEYEKVDYAVLWGTVTESMPELEAVIQKVLADTNGGHHCANKHP